MNKEEFIKEVEKLDLKLSTDQLDKLEIYKNYLQEYNTHTNLTAIIEDNEIYLKHFYDSLTIVKVIDLKKVTSLLDIGTGAGFPGMVLKIIFPNLKVTLLDSNNKKTTFLTNLAQKLNIEVEIINERSENYANNNLNKFDVVTSRAVANLRVLSELALPLVKNSGLFIPLKGNLDANLEDAKETINILGAKVIKHINFELYNNNGKRNILVIQKNRNTLLKELRPYDKIIKKPLQKVNK